MIGENGMRRRWIGVCCGLGLVLVLGRGALAWAFPGEIPLEKQSPPPPPGTVITHVNWEQYKDYMTLGQQLLWGGKMYWKYAPDARWRIVATKPWPIPPYYKADTAKYAAQVRLKKLPSGGTLLENYVAGLPFPEIAEPDAAAKILQNVYYRFAPFAYWSGPLFSQFTDRFGNASENIIEAYVFRLAHLSDPSLPHTVPGNAGFDYTSEQVVFEPETAKYVTQLTSFYEDQTAPLGLWNFVPSLRRVLRLSASAYCSPSVAGDLYREDIHGGFFGGNYRFVVKLIDHKKLLMSTNFTPLKGSYPSSQETKEWGLDGYIANPKSGEWEVREGWVIELMPIAELRAGYCYQPKRLYLDGEMFAVVGVENYDSAGKLWKIATFGFNPKPDGYGNFYMGATQDGWFNWTDIQNDHTSQIVPTPKAAGNLAVPEPLRNMQRWALPSGLAMIMQ